MEELLPYLSLINVPVAIGVFKIIKTVGKWAYVAERIEKKCCLMTLHCPLIGNGGDNNDI